MIQLPKTKLVRFFTATGVVALIVLTAKYCHLVPSGANAPSRSGHQLNFFCFLFLVRSFSSVTPSNSLVSVSDP